MQNSRVEDIKFYSKKTIRIGEKLISIDSPLVMGIINCTPDSFYENSRFNSIEKVLKAVEQQVKDGADIVDLGAYSSRPGAENISEEEECSRIIPVVKAVRKEFPELILSIDTFRGKVAEEGILSGANIINDIGAFELDKNMIDVLKKYKLPYILMHSKGNPQTMQNETNYDSLFKEICYFFSSKINQLKSNGIHDIILDPGFGFAKTIEQNYELLNRFADFGFLNYPILAGISRKSMIYKKLNSRAEEALNGTTILNTKAILNGASIIRVHDVKEAKEILNLLK
ncbi:MAG: dihydropteroate synthase [Flavobacteriia bacterium]|jgi:dihydropteroate synthase